MAEEFVNYKSFNDKAVAVELYEKLKREGLPVKWESSVGIFDASFANDEFMHTYYVKIRSKDFKKADEIMMESVMQSDEEPAEDYYLYSFTNRELVDVVKNTDEWNEYDRYWARRMLAERDIHITENVIEEARSQRLAELKKPWKLDIVWIIGAILLLMLGLAGFIFATAASLFIGIHILYGKKTMPDGERVPAFTAGSRLAGKVILIAAIIAGIVNILFVYGIVASD